MTAAVRQPLVEDSSVGHLFSARMGPVSQPVRSAGARHLGHGPAFGNSLPILTGRSIDPIVEALSFLSLYEFPGRL